MDEWYAGYLHAQPVQALKEFGLSIGLEPEEAKDWLWEQCGQPYRYKNDPGCEFFLFYELEREEHILLFKDGEEIRKAPLSKGQEHLAFSVRQQGDVLYFLNFSQDDRIVVHTVELGSYTASTQTFLCEVLLNKGSTGEEDTLIHNGVLYVTEERRDMEQGKLISGIVALDLKTGESKYHEIQGKRTYAQIFHDGSKLIVLEHELDQVQENLRKMYIAQLDEDWNVIVQPKEIPFSGVAKIFHRRYVTLAVGFGGSLLIEAIQHIFVLGSADVDDLFCNTLGTTLGFCLCMVALSIVEKRPVLGAAYGMPPLLSAAVLAGVFIAYYIQPYGNLADAPAFAANTRGWNGCWSGNCLMRRGQP